MKDTLYDILRIVDGSYSILARAIEDYKKELGIQTNKPIREDVLARQRQIIRKAADSNPTLKRALNGEQTIQARLLELDDIKGLLSYLSRSQRKDAIYHQKVSELGELIPPGRLSYLGCGEEGYIGIVKRGEGICKGLLKILFLGPVVTLVTLGHRYGPFLGEYSDLHQKRNVLEDAQYLDDKIKELF